ncbi:MAG TPA: hypothetical protein VD813_07160, partial [Pseudonocardia sp.]|nr:hypothetical protein [Pseudonocardia sp.]
GPPGPAAAGEAAPAPARSGPDPRPAVAEAAPPPARSGPDPRPAADGARARPEPGRAPRPARPGRKPTARRRRMPPWALLAVVALPLLAIAGWAVFGGRGGGGGEAVRTGGTVLVGETYTFGDGLAISVSPPSPIDPAEGVDGHQVVVSLGNEAAQPVSITLVTIGATVAGTPAEPVYSDATFAAQEIVPGQRLTLPWRFTVPEGVTGPLEITVTDSGSEPAVFTGEFTGAPS